VKYDFKKNESRENRLAALVIPHGLKLLLHEIGFGG
jgi:hypothetical protein